MNRDFSTRKRRAHNQRRRQTRNTYDYHRFWESELGIALKRPSNDGWTDGGRSPLRNDRNPGSFRVNLQHGGFCDFATDHSGSAVDFLMAAHGLSIREALRYLEEYAQ